MPKGVYKRESKEVEVIENPTSLDGLRKAVEILKAAPIEVAAKSLGYPAIDLKSEVLKNVLRGTCIGNQSKCGHSKEYHYDGKKGHCNAEGCVCDSFYS